MSPAVIQRNVLFSHVSDMENGVADMVRWSKAIRSLGCCDCHIDPGELYVIGKAMIAVAEDVQGRWNQCFEAAAALREGTR